jgi:flagellar biosynthesis protein FlhF
VDRIIFTKLDEAVSFGVLLNVARKVNKRLSYVTTGQEVPHQIEPGTPGRLAALVLGEEV